LYQVEKADKFGVKVIVDKKYKFDLWLSDSPARFKTFSGFIDDLKFSDDQKEIGWKIAGRHRTKLYKDNKEMEERGELKRLLAKYPGYKE
jgi:hypothetical protein